jgi:hypothetical protein
VDCTVDSCLSQGYCSNALDNGRCSDDVTCNGTETCDGRRGCIAAPPPNCNDQDPCTLDRCDEAAKDCVHEPRDFDHDGEADYHCPGGTDCDDFDAARNMSVAETCRDGIDNDCDDLVDENDCGALAHDTCVDPLNITGGGTFEVPIVGAVGDYTTSCGQMDSPHDLVFDFTLDAPGDVKLVAHGLLGDGSEEVASLSIERACGDSASEVQCARGFPSDLRVRALAAGHYYVIASSSVAVRSLLLTASFGAATEAPPNATCAQATEIGQGGHFEGDFVDVGDEITSRCAIQGQPDVFYAFTLDQEQDVEISAVGGESGALSVSVRTGCDSDVEVGPCQTGLRVLTRLHRLPKGSYVLVLEGPATREIGFMLDVAVTEPTPAPVGDTCLEPLNIALGETRRVSLTNLQADAESSCQSVGPDAVFALHVPTAQDLQIKLDGENAFGTVALQTSCGDPRSERLCRSGMPLTTRLHDVAAGDYFLVVDSPTAAGLTLQVEGLPLTLTVPVMGNDTCYSAADIPETGGLFAGDTRPLLADYSAHCGGGALSKDAAFRLMLSSRKHVVATIDAGFDSVLLRFGPPRAGTMACSELDPAACIDDTGSGNSPTLDEALDPGTYYYIVDGYKDFNAGSYLFDVAVTDPE